MNINVNIGLLHEDMQLIGVLSDLDFELVLNKDGGFLSHVDEDFKIHFNIQQGETLVVPVFEELERLHPNVDALITEDEFNKLTFEQAMSRSLLIELKKAFEA